MLKHIFQYSCTTVIDEEHWDDSIKMGYKMQMIVSVSIQKEYANDPLIKFQISSLIW